MLLLNNCNWILLIMYQRYMYINKDYCNNDSNDIYEQCLELLSGQPRAGHCTPDTSFAEVLQPALPV